MNLLKNEDGYFSCHLTESHVINPDIVLGKFEFIWRFRNLEHISVIFNKFEARL
jgi:hypothetical protein